MLVRTVALLNLGQSMGSAESVELTNSIINIDPGENTFPSREQKLDIETPDVAHKLFRLAFGTRKLGVVNELKS